MTMLLDNPKLEIYRAQAFGAGHPEHAAALELAQADIEAMEKLYVEAVQAPQFIMAPDENGEMEKFECDEPWERLDIAVQRVARNVKSASFAASSTASGC